MPFLLYFGSVDYCFAIFIGYLVNFGLLFRYLCGVVSVSVLWDCHLFGIVRCLMSVHWICKVCDMFDVIGLMCAATCFWNDCGLGCLW
jgi:hypothetical protein